MHIVEDKADELKKVLSKKKLNFILNAQNQVKSTSLANVALILRVDPHLAGVFKWNVFTEAIDATKDVKIDLSKWNMPNIHIKKKVQSMTTWSTTLPYTAISIPTTGWPLNRLLSCRHWGRWHGTKLITQSLTTSSLVTKVG